MTNKAGERKAKVKSIFEIGRISFSSDSYSVKESAVLRMNISAEMPVHKKPVKLYQLK
jgi:hypothetical protein